MISCICISVNSILQLIACIYYNCFLTWHVCESPDAWRSVGYGTLSSEDPTSLKAKRKFTSLSIPPLPYNMLYIEHDIEHIFYIEIRMLSLKKNRISNSFDNIIENEEFSL